MQDFGCQWLGGNSADSRLLGALKKEGSHCPPWFYLEVFCSSFGTAHSHPPQIYGEV